MFQIKTPAIYTLRAIIKPNRLLMGGLHTNCHAKFMEIRENWQYRVVYIKAL
jgi:hypothetical protein